MSSINYASKEINFKIVYFGPSLAGKATNLQCVYDKTSADAKGKMTSLVTGADKVVLFDFLPELGGFKGFKARLQLYTVSGKVQDSQNLKLLLKGVDGIVFVADSQTGQMAANQKSLEELRTNLAEQGNDLNNLPYIIQYNKRDLPEKYSLEEMRTLLNPSRAADFETVAQTGIGIMESVKAMAKLVFTEAKKSM